MSEKETIKITIMGKERDLTLEDLIEIYRQIDDLSPERNARASFVMHKKVQDRKREISKAMDHPRRIRQDSFHARLDRQAHTTESYTPLLRCF